MAAEVYSPRIQAAIANWLSFTDSLKNTNLFGPLLASGEFQKRFGTLNFAGLEEVFRASRFNTYCLAVPVEIVNTRMDSVFAVSPDDSLKVFRAKQTSLDEVLKSLPKLPYVAYLYPGYKEIQTASQDWGFGYDRVLNLANLHQAGMTIAVPGTPLARQVMGMTGRN